MDYRYTPVALLRNLNWRTKALLILVGSIGVFVGVVAVTLYAIVLPSVERTEFESMGRQIDQLATRHGQRQSRLRVQAADLARSERLRRIAEQGEAFDGPRSFLDHMRAAQLDLLVLSNVSGQIVLSQSVERRGPPGAPPPGFEQPALIQTIATAPAPASDEVGILPTPRGVLLYARRALKAPGETTTLGTLLVGELMPMPILENRIGASDLRIRLYDSYSPLPRLADAQDIGPGQLVAAIGENELVGRLTLTDGQGQATGTLEIRTDRPFRTTQLHNARTELWVIGGAVLVIALVLWWVIEVAFVRRLEKLTALVAQKNDADTVRLLETFPGSDEVGRLARSTGQMADHLKHARDLAISADRAKSSFLRMISHELRTPMNGVIGFSTLLRDTSLTPEQAEYVKTIEECSQSLLKLLDDLLNYTSIESAGVVLNPRPIPIREWLSGVVRLVAIEAEQKGLLLQEEVSPDVPPLLWTDPARLQQVLLHLLSNALKFTPAGSVSVKAEVAMWGGPDDSLIRFRVIDTGVGIVPEVGPQLFNVFTPGDNSDSRRFRGLGMGLVICRRLIEAMGGSITFKSAPNRGSEFSFTLPTRPPHSALGETPTAGPKPEAESFPAARRNGPAG